MPEDILSRWFKLIKPHWKLAFFSAIAIGLFSNMLIFTNSWPNHDGLMNLYSEQKNFSMGRYFLFLFSGISSYFDLPWITGALSVLYLAGTAVVLTELFELRKKVSIVLTAGLIVTFPTITSTFSYMFTADAYMAASFLTALSLLLTVKFTFGFLPGALLFYLGVGVYQANLPFLMTLVTLLIIKEILFKQGNLLSFLQLVFRTAILMITGMVLYGITFLIHRSFFETTSSDYQGFGEFGNSSEGTSGIFMKMLNGNAEFFFRGFYTEFPVNLFELLNAAVLILLIIGFVLIIRQNRIHLNRPLIFAAIFLMISLPFSAFSLYIISPEINYHLLMVLGLLSIYMLPILFYDNLHGLSKEAVITSWGIVLASFLVIFNFALIANISYLNQQLKFERAQALTNRIIMTIESSEDYHRDVKVAVIGRPRMYSEISREVIPSKIPKMAGALYRDLLREPHHFQAMMTNYFGVTYDFIEPEEVRPLKESEKFRSMPTWPSPDSIQMIDDVLVVKLRN